MHWAYFHDFLGSVQDSADICVYNNASNNIITDNRCFGGNDHGILIENPYNNAFPSNNLGLYESRPGRRIARNVTPEPVPLDSRV